MRPCGCMTLKLLLAAVLAGGLASCGGDDGEVATVPVADSPTTPKELKVPTLAYDQNSIVLVWEKPADYADVVDFNVYQNGKLLGSASANNDKFSPAASYIKKFHADDKENFHVKTLIHNFTVEGLQPDTEYRFTVRAVLKDGKESPDSQVVVQKTAAPSPIFDISKYGAVAGDTQDRAVIKANTLAIQKTIDSCAAPSKSAYGCKVLVPAGTFKTGALFLRSNMTLEVAEGGELKASDYAEDFPRSKGYLIYYYRPIRRSPALLNGFENDQGKAEPGTYENIRLVGKGALNGNGWLPATSGATIKDEVGNTLPQLRASNADKVFTDGVLAKALVEACVAEIKAGLDPLLVKDSQNKGSSVNITAYNNCRSSLVTVRGVRNMYYGGLTMLNPSHHGIMNLETENVVINGLQHKTYDANNADGIEMGNSQNAMVLNNFFDTGDDSMNFAAGQGEEASKLRAQSGAWIFNNYFREGHGAVVTGSHTGAWIEKIKAEDNVMYLTDVGLRCKSTAQTGGGGREILFRDNAMKNITNQAFIFTLSYPSNGTLDYTPVKIPAKFTDIVSSNVSVDGTGVGANGVNNGTGSSGAAIEVAGAQGGGDQNYPDAYHEKLSFNKVKFRNVNPTKINWLQDSSFNDVTFESTVPAGTVPWVISNSRNNVFTGSTPKP